MMGYLDRMNLRPAERRLVVLVALVLFVVANLIFVWPYFGSWNLANLRLQKAEDKLASYQKEIAQTNLYRAQLAEFEKENPEVPTEDQALQFQRTIQNQAAQSGFTPNYGRTSTRTNDAFFLEQVQTINVQSKEKDLVEFLYQLGAGSSLIRVRELSLRPDQQHYTLGGSITLVASYQKKPPVKGSSTAKPAAATPRPAPTAPGIPPTTPATATAKPAGTNVPAKSGGVWATVKGWFGGGSTTTATAPKTNAAVKPGPPGAPTGAPTGAPISLTNRVNPMRPTPAPPVKPAPATKP